MTIAQGGGSSSKDLIRSVSGHSNNLMSEVSKVIIGKPENIRKVAIGILANGNILIEDNHKSSHYDNIWDGVNGKIKILDT